MRPTWVEISQGALRHNFGVLRQRAQKGGAELLAVIKADAYGHGLGICGRVLCGAGAPWLGVTSVEEGVHLRQLLAEETAYQDYAEQPRILVMGGAWKGEAEAVIEYRLTPVVWESYQLDMLEQGARRAKVGRGELPVHLEIDTGMSRQGVPLQALGALLERFQPATGTPLKFEAMQTHYASAEDHVTGMNEQQTSQFCKAALISRKADLWPRFLHGGNSSTLVADDGTLKRLHELARGLGAHLMVRPGVGLYGYLLPEQLRTGERAAGLAVELQPVLSWKTRVIGLRDGHAGDTVGYGGTWRLEGQRRIALLPVGYADGYSRRLSRGNVTGSATNTPDGGEILVRGRRAPVIGRVSMDLTTVDVTEIPDVEVGDEVVLLGVQDEERISADDIARARGTISYEVLCGVGARVKRIAVE
jgi:alanine racemase